MLLSKTPLLYRPAIARFCVIVALFVIWEIAARWFVDPLFISPPSRVVSSLRTLLQSTGVVRALMLALWELCAAFCISVAIGLAVGLAVGLHRFSHRALLPIIFLLYAIPQVTILPLFILYFGIGPASKIAYGVSHGIFPIIVNVVAGAQNVKPILLLSARSMGGEPQTDLSLGDLAAHDAELFYRHAAGDDRRVARRAPGGAVRLLGGHRLFHPPVYRKLRSDQAVRAGRRDCGDRDCPQRNRAPRRAALRPLALGLSRTSALFTIVKSVRGLRKCSSG
jgi:hypothetical protein